MTASRIPGLDALRGLAALLVLAYHARGLALPMGVMGHGYLAVDLFFVISGFVLARAYDAPLAAGEGAAFMVRRLKRLYPMMLLGLLVGLAIWLAAGRSPVAALVLIGPALGFIPWPWTVDVFPLNGPQWSLMWELFANLAYAALAPWLTTARLTLLVAVSGIAHAALALIYNTGSLGPYGFNWAAGAPRVLFGFFAGVLLARLAAEGRLKVPAAPMGVILVALAFLLSPPVPYAVQAAFDIVAVLVAFPLLVASAARAKVGPMRPALDGLAGISYALYALHIPIVMGLARVAHHLPDGWARWGANAAAIPLALAAAWAAHRWFEPWVADLLRKKPLKTEDQGFSTSAPSSSTL